jgi:translation initiation factor IF-2
MIIAGGLVKTGKLMPKTLARIIRGKEQVTEVELASVQREKNEAKEVFEGEMCGIELKIPRGTSKFTLEIGDKIECFTRELKKRTL